MFTTAAASAINRMLAPLLFSEVAETCRDSGLAAALNERADLRKRPPLLITHAAVNGQHLTRQSDFILFCVVGGSAKERWRDFCCGCPSGWISSAPIAVGKIKYALRVVH